MIGRLAGRIAHRGGDHVLLDVGGVGYVVHVSERTLVGLPPVGQAAMLWTELLVREDLLQLFGFLTPVEKEWHRLLTSVQGVGAKGALAILSALGPDGVGRAIALGDAASVKSAPGVGPKIAQRIVNELRDKAPAVIAMGGATEAAPEIPSPEIAPGGTGAAAPPPVPSHAGGSAAAQAEAMSALGHLGYGPADASRAVAEAATDAPGAATEVLIRAALKSLAPKG